MRTVRCVLVEDHPAYADAVESLLKRAPRVEYCGTADTVDGAVELIDLCDPEVVLLDLHLHGEDGLGVIARARDLGSAAAFVCLTANDDSLVLWRALTHGASGYALKNVNQATLLDAVRDTADGETYICESTAARLCAKSLEELQVAARQARPAAIGGTR